MMASSFDMSHSDRIPMPTHACITLGSEIRRTKPRATLKYSPYFAASWSS